MAWKNVTRYRQRFVITVISMFLGIEMFLIVMVIITGSDYANIINQRPDFLIAGEFSEFAKKRGKRDRISDTVAGSRSNEIRRR